MRNSMMKKRIMAIAASAIMGVTAVSGAVGGTVSAEPTLAGLTAVAADKVVVASSVGFDEGMYATWSPVSGAAGYNVYVDGTKIDSMLIRQYSGYFRADAVGLKAGSHTMKIVPVFNGAEDNSKSAETTAAAKAHDRSGFGFVNGSASGAYNDDGTLKTNAVVLYVTNSTKDTVSMDVTTDSKGTKTSAVGIQNILTAYQKGYDSRPLCVRFIGNVTDPAVLMDGDLLLKGSGASKRLSCGVTIEGIGNDATFNGFGLRIANASNVEVRNLGFMNCNSGEGDDVGLQQNNDHVWVHHCDFFYGDAGSDADQVKGDGALDTKTSSYVTHSYNHFWDNGKCNLQGMKSETAENYITYHHNWYDHSDSRHPRIRTCTVHSYNNYFDGNAKYGVGATMGCSVFVENNYFRNCKYPVLASMQGSDIAYGTGTFSGEDGGIIKTFGNYMEGQKAFVTYQQNSTEFDAYEASSRSESVPSSVKTKKGGTSYNNFDTASSMYKYTPDDAKSVPGIVTANAGRVDGGDFQWKFDNSVDDESYAVNTALKSALTSYKDKIIAIGSGFKEDSGSAPIVTAPPQTTAQPVVTTVNTTAAPIVTPPVTGADVIYASPNGGGDGKSMSAPTDVLSAIKAVPAGGTIYLLEGTYKFSEMITIEQSNSGSEGKYKTISAYPGAKVVWDFSGQGDADSAKRGVALRGNYWHFYGFEITKAADNGMILCGNNNRIEMMVFNDNQDTGLQISRFDSSQPDLASWPSYNLILNCTAKNNCDNATMENADGFAAKLTCGEGNVFDGCMAYNNSDDGWDLFAKEATGPIGVVTLRNCIAFRNGFTEFGEGYGDCDGNGFKLGGSGVGSAHVVENCLAFENLNCGFTDNNNPKLGSLTNCTSYNNGVGGKGKPNISCYRCTDTNTLFTNVLSYINTGKASSLGAAGIKVSNDKLVGTAKNTIYYNSKYYYAKSDTKMENGSKLGDVISLADSDFINLNVPAMGTDFHTAWRKSDGTPNPGGFAETPSNGTYANVGYHMTGGVSQVPPTTTATIPSTPQTTTTSATQTSPTTTAPTTPVSGGYVHNFTLNGKDSSFYQITGNLSTSKGTVNYGGLTLTQCLKMESATEIGFSSEQSGELILVFAEPNATVKVDGTKYTANGDGIIKVSIGTAGAHTVTKADTANLFYMEFKTSEPAPSGLCGDANCDGEVTIADAAAILQYLGNNELFPLEELGKSNADNCDGIAGITVKDALRIQLYAVGLAELG